MFIIQILPHPYPSLDSVTRDTLRSQKRSYSIKQTLGNSYLAPSAQFHFRDFSIHLDTCSNVFSRSCLEGDSFDLLVWGHVDVDGGERRTEGGRGGKLIPA